MSDVKPPRAPRRTKTLWFLNGTLVKKIHISRAQGMITLHDINRWEKFMIPLSEWKKKRRRAYLVSETARLLNLHRKSLPRLVSRGILPPPVGATKDGIPVFGKKAYYSEDTIKDMREILAGQHIGRPRKDGFITNNKTPTALELSIAMGDSAQL
jgi:hypothetical protein